ncbi:hypothetical protein D9M72_573660 [compost metagenome]
MDQQHVDVAHLAHFHRLAGADGNHLDGDAGLLLEAGQQVFQQAGVLGAGGGGEFQFPGMRGRHHDQAGDGSGAAQVAERAGGVARLHGGILFVMF